MTSVAIIMPEISTGMNRFTPGDRETVGKSSMRADWR